MSKKSVQQRWFVAFDDLEDYEKVLMGLSEVNQGEEGFMKVCPDGKKRMSIEIKSEFVGQIQSAEVNGKKMALRVMTEDVNTGELAFAPSDVSRKRKPVRVSEPLFQIIKGASYKRRLRRQRPSPAR